MVDEICVLESNLASIQDTGRYGYEHYGFSVNGSLDQFAYRVGNALLGNSLKEPAIEVTAFNFSIKSHVDISVCVTGSPALIKIDEEVISQWETVVVKTNQILSVSKIQSGMRVYICVGGGINAPSIHGSSSYDSLLNIGTNLKKGDTLSLKQISEGYLRAKFSLPKEYIPKYGSPWEINICQGPDNNIFSRHIKFFEEVKFRVSLSSNHIGLRLERYKLKDFSPKNMLSRGIIPGAIEVTPSGQPIILHRGRGGTIGYPVIACVCSSDLDLVGQIRPRDTVQFKFISLTEAVKNYRTREKYIKQIQSESCILNQNLKTKGLG